MKDKQVVLLMWEESERGWGVRPDGYSLHLTMEDVSKFIKAYWKTMPDNPPSEYSRPASEPKTVLVDAKTYKEVVRSQRYHGMRGDGAKVWRQR